MKQLIMFNMISVDGFFEAPGRDINWHTVDEEFNEFAIKQIQNVETIIFGRITYELMVSYWPTDAAKKDDAAVASLMNSKPKIVCSTTMKTVAWDNTRLINTNVESELRRLKGGDGMDLIIFGSALLCHSLIKAGLIDEFRLMVSPIVLTRGTQLFQDQLHLELKDSRRFGNGNMLLTYSPV